MISSSQETEALARRIAAARRSPVETVVHAAFEQQARKHGLDAGPCRPRDPPPEAVATRRARTRHFVESLEHLPVLDDRNPQEVGDALDSL